MKWLLVIAAIVSGILLLFGAAFVIYMLAWMRGDKDSTVVRENNKTK